MAITTDYDSLKPLAILIHPGSHHDAKMFDVMMFELQIRRILRKGQLILADRGFYSASNYLIGINKYKIVSLIFAKKKPIITYYKTKLPPLDSFDFKNKHGKIFNVQDGKSKKFLNSSK
jgi:transposase